MGINKNNLVKELPGKINSIHKKCQEIYLNFQMFLSRLMPIINDKCLKTIIKI